MRSLIILFFLLTTLHLTGQEYTYFPPNILPDSVHAPFYHGIASGDPLSDRVIIWSRITPDDPETTETLEVNWEMSEDEDFSQIINSGVINTDIELDFTLKADVTGLEPNRTYYYRFIDGEGHSTEVGRTRTLPVGPLDEIKLALISCSNVYYGYFNSYRDIARNDELAAVIHVGDFIYNNDGRKAPTRIPEPAPYTINETNSKEEWEARHFYYHYDVDLRAMLAAHPLIVIWDNHDMSKENYVPAMRAWINWTPVREDPDDFKKLYRQFKFGDLIDLDMMDVRVYDNIDLLPGGEYNYLGNEQYDWLTDKLLNTDARWKFLGSQKNFATWNLGWVADLFDLNSPFFTTSNWDGHPESRQLMKDFFMDNSIDNLMFLTGDAHMGVLADIDPDPFDNSNDYDPRTGEGSLGVEFLPSGITGRNLDDRGVPSSLAPVVEEISMSINPHQFYLNLAHNGYGLLEVNRDSVTAYIRYNDILMNTDSYWEHGPFVVYNGTNHWKRSGDSYAVPTYVNGIDLAKVGISEIYPNPATDKVVLKITAAAAAEMIVKVIALNGAEFRSGKETRVQLEIGEQQVVLDVSDLTSGAYLVTLQVDGKVSSRQFSIVR